MTKLFLFLFLLILISSCSFDKKTGIWSGSDKEKRLLSEIEKEQKDNSKTFKVYSSENLFNKEKLSNQKLILSKPKETSSWQMSGKNLQNSLGHIYLTGINNNFLKKKVGKNKFSLFKNLTTPLIFNKNIIICDDSGTIFSINQKGKINWKQNIYKRSYKKIYKNLAFSIYENSIFVVDNIGFIYKINIDSGKIMWIKNHGIPLKSNIKIFKDKLFVINQDNRLLSFSTNDGSLLWDLRSVSSFIKSQNFLSLAIAKDESLVILNSSGDLMRLKTDNGSIYWTLSTLGSFFAHDADFFKSSKIVIDNNDIVFSTLASTFSFNLSNGQFNWQANVGSSNTPIIDGNNIFLVSNEGYFVNLNRSNGEIIWSVNILKILKESKQDTKVTGFIFASGKIYSVTENGYLIVSSASLGKVESFKKVSDNIYINPIISGGSLYVLTEKSKIFGFN